MKKEIKNGTAKWEEAIDKNENSKSFSAVHQRYLNNLNKGKTTRRFRDRKSS